MPVYRPSAPPVAPARDVNSLFARLLAQFRADPGIGAGAMVLPRFGLSPALSNLIRLYHGQGGAGGAGVAPFFSRNPVRAASYGGVSYVDVPRDIYRAGKLVAREAGSGTRGDVVLPPEWLNRMQPAPGIQPRVYDISEAGSVPVGLQAFLGGGALGAAAAYPAFAAQEPTAPYAPYTGEYETPTYSSFPSGYDTAVEAPAFTPSPAPDLFEDYFREEFPENYTYPNPTDYSYPDTTYGYGNGYAF